MTSSPSLLPLTSHPACVRAHPERGWCVFLLCAPREHHFWCLFALLRLLLVAFLCNPTHRMADFEKLKTDNETPRHLPIPVLEAHKYVQFHHHSCLSEVPGRCLAGKNVRSLASRRDPPPEPPIISGRLKVERRTWPHVRAAIARCRRRVQERCGRVAQNLLRGNIAGRLATPAPRSSQL